MELYTVKEVSKILKINVNLVYKLIKSGHLKALKLGALKVAEMEIRRFVESAAGYDFSDLDNVVELQLQD